MPGSTPTLRDMVNGARDRGLTYRQLAERAVDPETGQKASFALLNDLARNKVDRMPYDYHLRAIAAALGEPYERVRQAAIRQWVPPEDGENDTQALRHEARRIAEAVVRLTEATERTAAEVPDASRETG